MTHTEKYDISVGSGILSIFSRRTCKLERVFSEFVDNSLQSYLDHKEELKQLNGCEKCKVQIEWDSEKIVITDNAFGMNSEEFGRALKLRATNPNRARDNQLGIYGMGLKYAAVYLGNCYTIYSTALHSMDGRFAKINVKQFEEENPDTLDAVVNDAFAEDHQTKITITELSVKRTPKKEEDLRRNLGIIYHHYINEGLLSISINGVPVAYERPELRPNECGGYYLANLNSSFVAGGKEYKFTGWIGILNKGDQAITGINLVQAKRCIQLGYKPEKLFGKGNSFQSSRIIGEIVFEGENYVLSFDKDAFVWADDGAEEAFVNKLASLDDVKKIIKAAKELTFSDKPEKLCKKVRKSFSEEGPIMSAEVIPSPALDLCVEAEAVNEKNDDSKVQIEPPENRISETSKIDRYLVNVGDSTETLFLKSLIDDSNAPWIQFSKDDQGYWLTLNPNNPSFEKRFRTDKDKQTAMTFSILLASSLIAVQNDGLRLAESTKILNKLNELLGRKDD